MEFADFKTKENAKQYVKENDVLDATADSGTLTELFQWLWPEGLVNGMWPNPDGMVSYEILRSKVMKTKEDVFRDVLDALISSKNAWIEASDVGPTTAAYFRKKNEEEVVEFKKQYEEAE